MPSFKRIALIMGQDLGYCREVLYGVQAFALQQRSWVFQDAPPSLEMIAPLREWRPDGIIAHLFEQDVAKALVGIGIPTVSVTSTLEGLDLPLVEVDHLAVGRMGAEHFLDGGFRHFGYFGSEHALFSVGRERGFRERLQASGLSYSSCYAEYLPRPGPDASWAGVDDRVSAWLRSLPRPVGVLASNDAPARELAKACRLVGLDVPHDVAILGVDNDELETGLSTPPLSSIAIPGRRVGFEAAALLQRLMSKEPAPAAATFLPPQGVIVRQSSDIVAVDDPELAAMLTYIREHAAEPSLGVDDLFRHLNVSRRKLERRFRRGMNRSIHDEIRRVRIDWAKRLLATTDLSVPAIAAKSGFGGARRLSVVFRQACAMTPTDYRRQFRYH